MKNSVYWDVMPCGFCKNCSVLRLLVIGNVPSSPILVTLMMEAIRSSGMSVLTRTTLHNIQEDGILQRDAVFKRF
jgi:hypothetical protein